MIGVEREDRVQHPGGLRRGLLPATRQMAERVAITSSSPAFQSAAMTHH